MKNVLRTLVFENQVSLTLLDTTDMVNEAITLHNLSPVSARVLGRALSAMAFASASLKMEVGEISLSMQCDGAAGSLGVSGNYALKMRGYIQNTQLDGDETACLGQSGVFTIIRDDGYRRPFVGTCALPDGDIDAAFEKYYQTSEQLPTYIKTTVELDENGVCTFAGAAVIQPLPFAEDVVLQIAANYPLDGLLHMVKTQGVEQAAEKEFGKQESVWGLRFAEYKCNCSKEYLSRVLVTLGEDELRNIIKEDGAISVHCHYCNKDYQFVDADVDELFPKNVS